MNTDLDPHDVPTEMPADASAAPTAEAPPRPNSRKSWRLAALGLGLVGAVWLATQQRSSDEPAVGADRVVKVRTGEVPVAPLRDPKAIAPDARKADAVTSAEAEPAKTESTK